MALSNKIWLNEMTQKTTDDVLEDIWNSLDERQKTFSEGNAEDSGHPGNLPREIACGQEQGAKKKRNFL
jgi:hypothetical protein